MFCPCLLPLSVAAAGDDKKGNEKKPDIVVFKKMAKAVVHRCSYPLRRSAALFRLSGGALSLFRRFVIILCQSGKSVQGRKCKMQSAKLGFIGEKLQREEDVLFREKEPKSFYQLRGKISRKLCCDVSQHITIFSLLAGSSKICNLLLLYIAET